MPGRKLSHLESKLAAYWEAPPAGFPKPLLRSISVEGDAGLRGVRRMSVPFQYPLTVVCGRNGVGKSTLLALASISAKPPQGWEPFWGNTKPRGAQSVQYVFKDFFHRTAGSPALDGMQLTWVSLYRGNEIEQTKRWNGSRWVKVPDPGRNLTDVGAREVDFIPVSRILPASELAALRTAFTGTEEARVVSLNAEAVQQLSYIMGKQYTSAGVRFAKGLVLPTCRSTADYTGFDMGGGEGSVILLLARLQGMPIGGLVVIEEVELALHQEAQARLVEVLLRYCDLPRRLQIICTSHSATVIDAVPRQARVLISKLEDEHQATPNISTRFAVHQMLGEVQPELRIYTEDGFASMLVGECIAGELRSRVRIQDVGSNTVLARQAVAHARAHANEACLSVFDGDCTEAQVEAWIISERAERELQPDVFILPGGVSPERWVLQQLQNANYRASLAREIGCLPAEAATHIDAMAVELDHHDCGHTLHLRTGLDRDAARRMVAKSVARDHPELEPLRARVRQMLGA